MQIKDGVILSGLNIQMRQAMIIAEHVYKTHNQELVITSGLDGLHSAGSLHYSGNAIDIRTRFFNNTELESVFAALNIKLSLKYKVILERTHIHIELKV